MLTVDFLIIALLIAAFVLFVLSFFMGPRTNLWIAAACCAVVALVLKVFGVGG
jgi:hypothetical protein